MIALLFNRALWLRSTLILGYIIQMAAVFVMGPHVDGMTAILIFAIINMSINIYHIIKFIYINTAISIPSQYKEIYKRDKRVMKPREFMQFVLAGKETHFNQGDILVKKGVKANFMLIVSGSFSVMLNQKKIAELTTGQFVGEMGLITNQAASADITCSQSGQVVVFSNDNLTTLRKKSPTIYDELMLLISKDLVIKLKRSSEDKANTTEALSQAG